MNIGFRKQKAPQPSDTTGITPQIRTDQQRSVRRAQQITHLHQQFEDLKKKIKEVQNKNEKIIQKIYKAYNFKKKNAYTEEYIGSGMESPVIHYEKNYGAGFSGAMSVDAHSNKSDQSQNELKMKKRTSEIPGRKALKNQKFNYSLEYGKANGNIAEQDYEPTSQQYMNQAQMRYTTGQFPRMPPVYPQNPSFTSVVSQKKLVDELSQQKQILEQELSQKSSEVMKLNSSIKTIQRNLRGMIQANLQDFYENVCLKNLLAVQKAVKKYQQKLKIVKKATMVLKDKQQDKKSSRLLEQGRQRRSLSRSRRASPRNNSRVLNNSRELREESRSRSRVAGEQGQRNKREFQQIANKYEQIIRSKNQEIQKWDKKYKIKQRQCYELKMRVDIIQKRLNQEQKRSRGDMSQDSSQYRIKNMKKLAAESDLLSGIDEKVTNLNIFEEEMLKLQAKVQQLNAISHQKSAQISNLQNLLAIAQNRNKAVQSQCQQSMNKNKQKYLQQQEKYKKQFEKIIAERNDEIISIKNSLMATEKKFLQKQCQYYTLESKIKKMEGLITSKDEKIQELEKIIGDNQPTDRSGLMNSTILHNSSNMQGIKKLKEEIQVLETKLESDKNQIFSLTKKNSFYKNKTDELERINGQLKKQVQMLQIQNEQLKINVNINNISAVMKEVDDNSREEDDVSHSLGVMDENMKKFTTDLDVMNQKINELTNQKQEWYGKYQKIKSQNLQKESQGIKIKSQFNFIQKQLADSQGMIAKLKSENQKLKLENKELQRKFRSMEQEIEVQREQFKIQLNDIEKRWIQFEDDMRKSGVHVQIDKSQKSSVFSYNQRNKIDLLNTQNEYLTVKLKEAQAQIEAQKMMEQKIIDQYQTNMEEYKIEIKSKGQQILSLKQQNQDLNIKVMNLNMRLQAMSKADSPLTQNRKEQKNQLLERIQQLQAELKEAKEINAKLTDMEGQLFDQIKIKQEERGELYDELRKKQARVQQLEEIIDMKGELGVEQMNPHGSHISRASHQRDSVKSQSSLKYSSHSQILRKSRMMNSGKSGTNEQKLFDLDLSQAGSEFYEQPSQISNISQFFQKEQLPYEKIKIKRQQQIKLFQKTASYIKSLKKAIEQKNKKIKLLEKKIQSLRNSELVRKELGLDIDIKEDRYTTGSDYLQADDTFKDYESVQLEYKRGGHLRRYKQLQHDTKLVMEENNLLIQQIQTLEEELLKAEEQENSLVKIKDLYKEEIKKLIKKNEEQTKAFEQELKNEKKRVQDIENVQNIQAIKHLYTKTIQATGLIIAEENLKKKQQRRKQIQEFVKKMSQILRLDKKSKQNLLTYIHK